MIIEPGTGCLHVASAEPVRVAVQPCVLRAVVRVFRCEAGVRLARRGHAAVATTGPPALPAHVLEAEAIRSVRSPGFFFGA